MNIFRKVVPAVLFSVSTLFTTSVVKAEHEVSCKAKDFCLEQVVEDDVTKTLRRLDYQAYVVRLPVEKLDTNEWIDAFASLLRVSGNEQLMRKKTPKSKYSEGVGISVPAFHEVKVDFGGDALHFFTNLVFTSESSDGVYFGFDGCKDMKPVENFDKVMGVEFYFNGTVCFDRDIIVTYIRGQFDRNGVPYNYSAPIK